MVLGSGPIRIGQGIEFDYSSVHCVWTLKELGYEVVIVNNNPETVSTDYDTADRLYFEPLFPEDVMHIIAGGEARGRGGGLRRPDGHQAHQVPGRATASPFWAPAPTAIDMAEDRERFDALLERFAYQAASGPGDHRHGGGAGRGP